MWEMASKLVRERVSIPWKHFAKEGWERVVITAKFLLALHLTSNHVCGSAVLAGPSMQPTLEHGDIVLVEKLSTRFGKIKPGDVVVGVSPDNPKRLICKRVLGLEGDVVEFMSIDGRTHSIMVPKGHVWLQGDNAPRSNDSRNYGPVPYGLLHGRVVVRVMSKIGSDIT